MCRFVPVGANKTSQGGKKGQGRGSCSFLPIGACKNSQGGGKGKGRGIWSFFSVVADKTIKDLDLPSSWNQ